MFSGRSLRVTSPSVGSSKVLRRCSLRSFRGCRRILRTLCIGGRLGPIASRSGCRRKIHTLHKTSGLFGETDWMHSLESSLSSVYWAGITVSGLYRSFLCISEQQACQIKRWVSRYRNCLEL
jgi:hypothetical protein